MRPNTFDETASGWNDHMLFRCCIVGLLDDEVVNDYSQPGVEPWFLMIYADPNGAGLSYYAILTNGEVWYRLSSLNTKKLNIGIVCDEACEFIIWGVPFPNWSPNKEIITCHIHEHLEYHDLA